MKTRRAGPPALLAAALAAVLCTGCLTTYRPGDQDSTGLGYGETRLKPDLWKVYFQSSPGTEKDWLEAALLYRCADVVSAAGYEHFLLLESNTAATTSTFRFTDDGRTVHGRVSDSSLRAEAVILARKGPAPPDDPGAFDAQETMKLLGKKVKNNNPRTR